MKVTDIDDVAGRDLLEKSCSLVKMLAEKADESGEVLLTIVLHTLDKYRTEWSVNGYHKGYADGVAERKMIDDDDSASTGC